MNNDKKMTKVDNERRGAAIACLMRLADSGYVNLWLNIEDQLAVIGAWLETRAIDRRVEWQNRKNLHQLGRRPNGALRHK